MFLQIVAMQQELWQLFDDLGLDLLYQEPDSWERSLVDCRNVQNHLLKSIRRQHQLWVADFSAATFTLGQILGFRTENFSFGVETWYNVERGTEHRRHTLAHRPLLL